MLPFSSCAYACMCLYIRCTHMHTHTHMFAQSPFRHLFLCLQGPELMEDLTSTWRKVLIWRNAVVARNATLCPARPRNTRTSSQKSPSRYLHNQRYMVSMRAKGKQFVHAEAQDCKTTACWRQFTSSVNAWLANQFLCLLLFLNVSVFPAHHFESPVSALSLSPSPSFFQPCSWEEIR